MEVVMGSINRGLIDGVPLRHDAAMPTTPGPMARQFNLSNGNEPTPQIMLQLIGCHVENRPLSDSHQLKDVPQAFELDQVCALNVSTFCREP
jgi:hypothetical protein